MSLALSLAGCAARAPVASPDVTLGAVMLRADFDDPSGGPLPASSNNPQVEQGYRRGEYFVSLSSSFNQFNRAVGPTGSFANVRVSVEARLGEETAGRWVGVACRLTPRGFYALVVLPATGRVVLARQESGQIIPLAPPESRSIVRRGNAVNHLELTCAGSTIVGRVNGTDVGSGQDPAFDRGSVMVLVGREAPRSVQAWFDNLIITEVLSPP